MRFWLSLAVVAVLLAAGMVCAGLPTVTHDGRAYVELDRIAKTLDTRPDATPSGTRAYLRTPGHVVTLTRNWAQILVDGSPLVLDGPVVVKSGVWLVPQGFVARVLPKLAASAPSALPRALAEARLTDLRLRSYPSFTRVVLETSAPATHKIEPGASNEARIRIAAPGAETQAPDLRDALL